LGCLLLVLLACGTGAGWLWWTTQRGWTVAKVKQLIRQELPPGCGREQVEAWFDRHGIEYGYCEEVAGNKELSGTLEGEIEDANVDLIFSGEISVCFFFDKNGRMVSHRIRRFVFCP
jgi:hypothetical protein